MKVPLSKPYVDQEIRDAVLRALDSGQYILGPECQALEKELAAWFGTAESVLVTSGTAAIQLTLEALGVKPGDEIIVPSLTAFPTVEPLMHLGVVPRFADIDDTFTMDPRHAESLVGPRTVGIIPVHLYGHPADVPALKGLAERKKLFFLEDTCQGHGAEVNGKRCGAFGGAGFLSFYPSKNMTVAGDGGALLTSDAQVAAKARMLRNHGRKGRYEHEVAGYNLRFNELQAAVGRVQLKHLADFVAKRRAAAAKYGELLAPLAGRLALPSEKPWAKHSYHLYVTRSAKREELRDFLKAEGVATEVHYPVPCHLQPAVKAKHPPVPLPRTEKACAEILSLPMFPAITDAELEHVARSVSKYFAQTAARA